MEFVLNGKLWVVELFAFLDIPKPMRKLSTHSAGTPMTLLRPFLLVDVPEDSVLIPVLD